MDFVIEYGSWEWWRNRCRDLRQMQFQVVSYVEGDDASALTEPWRLAHVAAFEERGDRAILDPEWGERDATALIVRARAQGVG